MCQFANRKSENFESRKSSNFLGASPLTANPQIVMIPVASWQHCQRKKSRLFLKTVAKIVSFSREHLTILVRIKIMYLRKLISAKRDWVRKSQIRKFAELQFAKLTCIADRRPLPIVI